MLAIGGIARRRLARQLASRSFCDKSGKLTKFSDTIALEELEKKVRQHNLATEKLLSLVETKMRHLMPLDWVKARESVSKILELEDLVEELGQTEEGRDKMREIIAKHLGTLTESSDPEPQKTAGKKKKSSPKKPAQETELVPHRREILVESSVQELNARGPNTERLLGSADNVRSGGAFVLQKDVEDLLLKFEPHQKLHRHGVFMKSKSTKDKLLRLIQYSSDFRKAAESSVFLDCGTFNTKPVLCSRVILNGSLEVASFQRILPKQVDLSKQLLEDFAFLSICVGALLHSNFIVVRYGTDYKSKMSKPEGSLKQLIDVLGPTYRVGSKPPEMASISDTPEVCTLINIKNPRVLSANSSRHFDNFATWVPSSPKIKTILDCWKAQSWEMKVKLLRKRLKNPDLASAAIFVERFKLEGKLSSSLCAMVRINGQKVALFNATARHSSVIGKATGEMIMLALSVPVLAMIGRVKVYCGPNVVADLEPVGNPFSDSIYVVFRRMDNELDLKDLFETAKDVENLLFCD